MSETEVHEPILEATLRVAGLPGEGRDLSVEADAEQRQALASLLQVTAVDSMAAKLHATPFRGGVRVTGRVTARIEQPCVVTLDPVKQDIDEPVDRIFLPNREKAFAEEGGAEIFVDPNGEDLPDYFDGQDADFEPLLIETLALAIDPYPRAPGVSLDELVPQEQDESEESPFAVLKRFKQQGEPH